MTRTLRLLVAFCLLLFAGTLSAVPPKPGSRDREWKSYGAPVARFLAGEALVAGDLVRPNFAGAVIKTNELAGYVFGVVKTEKCASGAYCEMFLPGVVAWVKCTPAIDGTPSDLPMGAWVAPSTTGSVTGTVSDGFRAGWLLKEALQGETSCLLLFHPTYYKA